MKIEITPKSRNRDNTRTLYDQKASLSSKKITRTGVSISFDIQISTSGSFTGKVELSVEDIYALLGEIAQAEHNSLVKLQREIKRASP